VIDLDALDAAIAESERRNMFTAPIVKELIAELREARKAHHEVRISAYYDGVRDGTQMGRGLECADVLAWLREYEGHSSLASLFALMADTIERGEHRREENP
jgi:hypothetical protein